MSEIDDLKDKIKNQDAVISGLDRILKLNEQEIANAEEIIQMYEHISDFSRQELKDARETKQAVEAAGSMSAEELKASFNRIKLLDEENKKLREQRLRGK